MSLTAIINLAERLLNNSSGQSVDTRSTSKQSKQTGHIDSEAKTGDQFTPSAETHQDAGLFQVRRFSIFSAAADFFLSQPLQPPASTAAAPTTAPVNAAATLAAAQPTGTIPQDAAQTLAATTPFVRAQTPTVNLTPAVAAPPATALTAPAAATPAMAVNSTQSQLLALNTALYALGLNDSQLAQIDQIASLIQVFNPLAFTSLVYQLQALAQANAQQAAASVASTPATGTLTPPGTTANPPVTGTPAPAATAGNTSGTNTEGGFKSKS